jgi:hypothetical protein
MQRCMFVTNLFYERKDGRKVVYVARIRVDTCCEHEGLLPSLESEMYRFGADNNRDKPNTHSLLAMAKNILEDWVGGEYFLIHARRDFDPKPIRRQ